MLRQFFHFTDIIQNERLELISEIKAVIPVKSNKTLTEILINNLMVNAVRHIREGGQIIIKTTEHFFIIDIQEKPHRWTLLLSGYRIIYHQTPPFPSSKGSTLSFRKGEGLTHG
ncbi:MAG: hypothetical protein LUG18_11700 [Candidatus Azobacteroides sp.]|nr:hypothetical protein [Candidatus Azobacteroides sp.]